jgi:transposase
MSRKYKIYEEEFKKQIVELFNNGKSINQISKEYDISKSTVHSWVNNYNNSGSFKATDNRNETEKELIVLRKRNKQLEMENDILKQAALILGRK